MEKMLKIGTLHKAPNGATDPFDLEFEEGFFKIPEYKGLVRVTGELLKVEEGIMMLLSDLSANQEGPCARCGKPLKRKLNFIPTEWLFYLEDPSNEDDKNEWLRVDMHRFEIDASEPVRQELLLNLESTLRCAKPCKDYAPAEKPTQQRIKALAGLKDFLK